MSLIIAEPHKDKHRVITATLQDTRVTLTIAAEELVQLAGERERWDPIAPLVNAQLADVLVQLAARALDSRYSCHIDSASTVQS